VTLNLIEVISKRGELALVREVLSVRHYLACDGGIVLNVEIAS
jgi:hypothetical protein